MSEPQAVGQGVFAVQDTIYRLLARGYTQAAGPAIEGIVESLDAPHLRRRYADLEAEAERLAELGERLAPDNPMLIALLNDLEPVLIEHQGAIGGASLPVQQSGILVAGRTGAQAATGFTAKQLERVGVNWFTPDIEAVNEAVGYASSDVFRDSLNRYSSYTIDTIRNQAAKGIVLGQNPRTIAREITRMSEELPISNANTIMRTLQVTSYRDAAVANRVANADILEYQVRISALKAETCMACIALHGTTLPIDVRIDDHNNGLCTSITQVRGLPAVPVTPGSEWFNSLTKDEQRRRMGSATFRAFEAGKVKLKDFPGEYQHDVYGRQVVKKSLAGILGKDDAKEFYRVA